MKLTSQTVCQWSVSNGETIAQFPLDDRDDDDVSWWIRIEPRGASRRVYGVQSSPRLRCIAGWEYWRRIRGPTRLPASKVDDRCPRAALREMMASAAIHNDVGDVAALELEVLRLCNERQKLIVKVVEGEERLAELRGVKRSGSAVTVPETMMVGVLENLPLPAKASGQSLVPGVHDSPSASLLIKPERVSRSNGRDLTVPELRWTTVYGSAGSWVAGVTDGAKIWYVRAGDELPSGVRVESIRQRPPAVRVARNGEAWQIPGPGTPGVGGADTGRIGRGL